MGWGIVELQTKSEFALAINNSAEHLMTAYLRRKHHENWGEQLNTLGFPKHRMGT
jgi:hypothetical protein